FLDQATNDGLSKKPSLSAQGGPVVRSGENVTLLCSSVSTFAQFHLLREGETLGRLLAGGRGPHGALQAAFPLGPGAPAHSGVYRCYGSFTRSPYAWSDPSDPLFLSVTEKERWSVACEPSSTSSVFNREDSPEDDVIYAHLDLGTLSERLNTPTPLSLMHPFPEPSIYEEFNVKKDRAEP
ncbi:hypothetical protein FD754_022904, partial [Muntiacus muntjak]